MNIVYSLIWGGLIAGLVLHMIGIAFLRDRIRYIKRGNIAIATMFKQEERLGRENEPYYVPFFTFTILSNKEIIYEYRGTQSKSKWRMGDKIKVVYRELLTDDHEILRLSFYDAFGASAALLTGATFSLILAGGVYLNLAASTNAYLIFGSIALFLSIFFIWAQMFFKKLH